jgi:hypothetical protein
MNTHQMTQRVILNLAAAGQPLEIKETRYTIHVYTDGKTVEEANVTYTETQYFAPERREIAIDELTVYSTDGNWSPIGLEAYQGGSWLPVMAHQLWPIERTEADELLADAYIDPERIDILNLDTAPAIDARTKMMHDAEDWAWTAMRFFPLLPELQMVRKSILRDLVYTAEAAAGYHAKRSRQLVIDLAVKARLNDDTEVALEILRSAEEMLLASEAQQEDWEDLADGFRAAEDRLLEGEQPTKTWANMPRKVRQLHIGRWVLRFRDLFDGPEGARDRLHERMAWHLCNAVRRNLEWTANGLSKARPEQVRMWRLQHAAWEVMQPAMLATYRQMSDGREFALPTPTEDTAKAQRQHMIGSAISYTVEQYLAKYGVKPTPIKGPRRAALWREQASRDRLMHFERIIGETVERLH